MSEKVKGIVITFKEDVSKEKADFIMDALYLYRDVIDVSPVMVEFNDHMIAMQIKHEIKMKLFDVVK